MNKVDEEVLVLIKEQLLPGEKVMLFGKSCPYKNLVSFAREVLIAGFCLLGLIFLLFLSSFGVVCSIGCFLIAFRIFLYPASSIPSASHYALTSDRLLAVKGSVFTIADRDDVLKIRTQNDNALLYLPVGKVKFRFFKGLPEVTG